MSWLQYIENLLGPQLETSQQCKNAEIVFCHVLVRQTSVDKNTPICQELLPQFLKNMSAAWSGKIANIGRPLQSATYTRVRYSYSKFNSNLYVEILLVRQVAKHTQLAITLPPSTCELTWKKSAYVGQVWSWLRWGNLHTRRVPSTTENCCWMVTRPAFPASFRSLGPSFSKVPGQT